MVESYTRKSCSYFWFDLIRRLVYRVVTGSGVVESVS